MVYIVRSGRTHPPDTNTEGWKMAKRALPIRVKQLIVVQAYEENRGKLLDYLAYQTSRTAEFRAQQKPNTLVADSSRGTLALLERNGLRREHLPHCLGGDITSDWFERWVRQRISVEDIMSSTPLRCNRLNPIMLDDTSLQTGVATPAMDTMIIPRKKTVKNSANKTKKKATQSTEESRNRNALYGRRAYHKRKLEILGPEQQVRHLRDLHLKLREENRMLETYMHLAQQQLLQHMMVVSHEHIPCASWPVPPK